MGGVGVVGGWGVEGGGRGGGGGVGGKGSGVDADGEQVFYGACIVFFFQAEDGIRDLTVTGVQTCALPIWTSRREADAGRREGRTRERPYLTKYGRDLLGAPQEVRSTFRSRAERRSSASRSEERRVGKECRSRWSPYH